LNLSGLFPPKEVDWISRLCESSYRYNLDSRVRLNLSSLCDHSQGTLKVFHSLLNLTGIVPVKHANLQFAGLPSYPR